MVFKYALCLLVFLKILSNIKLLLLLRIKILLDVLKTVKLGYVFERLTENLKSHNFLVSQHQKLKWDNVKLGWTVCFYSYAIYWQYFLSRVIFFVLSPNVTIQGFKLLQLNLFINILKLNIDLLNNILKIMILFRIIA